MHRRAVSKYFGNALHHFRGVVTHANHGVGAMLASVFQKNRRGAAPKLPMRLRERTTIPRPIPKFPTIRYRGRSTPQITIPVSTLGICFFLKKWNGS